MQIHALLCLDWLAGTKWQHTTSLKISSQGTWWSAGRPGTCPINWRSTTLPSSHYSCVGVRLGRSPAVTSERSRRNISIHLRQPNIKTSHHWACVPHGLGNLQLHFHQGIIKLKWSNIQILIILWILPMRTLRYRDYIIHLFITRETHLLQK